MNKKIKVIILVLVVVLFSVLIIPIRSEQYDGVYYSAITYTVIIKHEIVRSRESSTGSSLIRGTQVYFFHVLLFDKTEIIEYDLASTYDH